MYIKGMSTLFVLSVVKKTGNKSNKSSVCRYDVTDPVTGQGSAGIAGLGTMCTADSTSIVEDQLDFIAMTVAAHELGHRYANTR